MKWACPDCGATANKHGRGTCEGRRMGNECGGFVCECYGDDDSGPSSMRDHGTTLSNRCPNARCYHCGWAGSFPPMPKKIAPWEKKALAEGWKPPKGWNKA